KVAGAHTRVKERAAQVVEAARPGMDVSPEPDIKTAVSADVLESLNRQLLSVPDGFAVNPKLLRQMERRRQPLAGRDIDWAQAEALAFASLVTGGVPARLTGQDTERGTVSQRHMVIHDVNDGRRWVAMQHPVGLTIPGRLLCARAAAGVAPFAAATAGADDAQESAAVEGVGLATGGPGVGRVPTGDR